MPLKKLTFLFGMIFSYSVAALPPDEVLHSCIKLTPPNSNVTITELISPGGTSTTEPGCEFKYERSENNFTYGLINCNDENFLILNGNRYSLKLAQNHSVNPSIKPGLADIPPPSDWRKIDFNGSSYLCINGALSDSGTGAGVSQYYITENAFGAGTPVIHFYFLNKEVMPLTSTE